MPQYQNYPHMKQQRKQTISKVQFFSFANWLKRFLDYQITYMTKLLIRVITNLLVNKLITELFDYGI